MEVPLIKSLEYTMFSNITNGNGTSNFTYDRINISLFHPGDFANYNVFLIAHKVDSKLVN